MRSAVIAAMLLLLPLSSAFAAGAGTGAINARWNEGSTGPQYLNLSVYEDPIGCDETRGALLRIGVRDRKPGAGDISVKAGETDFCMFFLDDKPQEVRCSGGDISLSFNAQTNEYHGKYDFRLNDADLKAKKMKAGVTRSGEFRARYCKPKNR